MTEAWFRNDGYARTLSATVVAVDPPNAKSVGIVTDRTIFYPQGGGQPADVGTMRCGDGRVIAIVNTLYDADRKTIIHVPAPDQPILQPGEPVDLTIDWEKRLARMKIHTALHLLSVVLPHPVTGGAIGDGEGRLDFDIPEGGLDRGEIEGRLNAMVGENRAVSESWITDEELEANPGLVKTMSVRPPTGQGRVRLIAIDGIDLQPCGGTHVRATGEIGHVSVTAIEKKGRQNRRVRIALGKR